MQPSKIGFLQTDVDDLNLPIIDTRWPDELPGVGFKCGGALDYLRALATYWPDQYDWASAEAELNQLPQYTATKEEPARRAAFLCPTCAISIAESEEL